jgi:hypothetical protein
MAVRLKIVFCRIKMLPFVINCPSFSSTARAISNPNCLHRPFYSFTTQSRFMGIADLQLRPSEMSQNKASPYGSMAWLH